MAALIGTSWKMNLTSSQAAAWFDAFLPSVAGIDGSSLFVLPPYPAIWVARHRLTGTGIAWGAQDVHPADDGAHTGDVSAPMLADLGCTFIEVGHSERRREHGETSSVIAAKVAAILRNRMRPILCVGELRRVDVSLAIELVLADLERCLVDMGPDSLDRVVVAYEPVWAIGEGAAAASSDHVGHLHRAIHEWFAARASFGAPVIYGGSVDEVAAAKLLAEPGVDGLFVGRRALDPLAFARIVWASGGTR